MRNNLYKSALVLVLASILAAGISAALNWIQPIPGIEFKVFDPLKIFEPPSPSHEEADLALDTLSNSDHMIDPDSTLWASNPKEEESQPEELKKTEDKSIKLKDTAIEDIPQGITDYSASGMLLSTVRQGLKSAASKSYNIAFLGDSFIEGDILVENFRNALQKEFGGMGVGFVPLTSQTARFRRSVKHAFAGDWKTKSVLRGKSRHLELLLSGEYQEVKGTASVKYSGIRHPENLSAFEKVVLLYKSDEALDIEVETNDAPPSVPKRLEATDGHLRGELLADGYIQSVGVKFDTQTVARMYGMLLMGNTGVNVDNYSLRGASGLQLSGVSTALGEDLIKIHPYHLIILSYGLNVVSNKDNQDSYNWYFHSMGRAIEHLKAIFPDAVIMIMSISDRATLKDGEVKTLNGVGRLLRQQHLLAQKYGCLFFNTYGAMKELGGISTFVDNGWAAKDYTHLSSRGGGKIANILYKYLLSNDDRYERE